VKTQVIGLALGLAACSPEVAFRSKSLEKVNPRIVSDQEFPAARIGSTSVTYQPLYGLVSEDLKLSEKPQLSYDLRQIERQLNFENYEQGYDGNTATQEFEISSAGKLDLLMVIDNSGSMGEEQAELSTNLMSMIKSLDSVDWQIGIVTTDTCRLQNSRNAVRSLRKGDPGVAATFESTIKGLGTSGSRDEQGIKMALQQLSGQCVGSPNSWLRSDASLAVFFVSDEQNECFGDPNCADDLGNKWGPTELIAQMRQMRQLNQLKAYALLWNKDTANKPSRNAQCRRDAGVETYGSMYAQVVDAFSGLEKSICLDSNLSTNDYGPLLEQISTDVNRSIQRDFMLSADPVSNSLNILVDGVPARDVQISGRKVTLRNAQANQIKLSVTYRYDAIPKFDRVLLKNRPAVETFDIKVANRPLNSSRLQYDENTGELIFLDVPQDREKVSVRYRTRADLPKTIDVEKIIEGSGPVTTVAIDGKIAQGWRLSDNGSKIIFDAAPLDASTITVNYKQKDAKILFYQIPSSHDLTEVQEITAKDKSTGETIAFDVKDDFLEFNPDTVEDGRELVIVYDYGRKNTRLSHELSQDPIPESVTLSSQNSKDECIQNVKVSGRDVLFDCSEDSIDDVTISYNYVEEKFDSFKIKEQVTEDDLVQVFVDGSAIQSFTRKGQIVTIPQNQLKLESKIRILVLASNLNF
jgi:hypothetical protein